MRHTLTIILTGLLITETYGYAQTAQEPKAAQSTKSDKPAAAPGEDAQRLATGEITKIDVKKKVLTVREASLDSPSDTGTPNGRNGPRRGGGMGGGRRRGGGGVGFPSPYPGGPGGGRIPTSGQRNQGKEFKVTVTDQTAIKDKVTTIGFDLLRVGDRIAVQGLPKGKGADLQATQITVNQ